MADDDGANYWVHLLFRGDRVSLGEDHDDDFVDEFRRTNLKATTIPILEFRYINLEELSCLLKSKINQQAGDESNGLIITSPRVVAAINKVLENEDSGNSTLAQFDPEFVFVVGDKTARECQSKLGLKCNTASARAGNSRTLADYIKTLCSNKLTTINLLYPKSFLADKSIENTLASENRIRLKPIVVYETNPIDNLADVSSKAIQRLEIPAEQLKITLNLIFFSPSGIESFLRMGQASLSEQVKSNFPKSDIEFKYSSIGKTTEAALLRNDIQVDCVSEKPNPASLVECILKTCSKQ